jgi:CHAT domain-containing protein/Tfp pilus assembly protein PilF
MLAVLVASCQTAGSLKELALQADGLLKQERFNEELPIAEKGLRAAEHARDAGLIWRFRLLRADGLMGKRAVPETLKALAGYGQPPAGTQWSEVRGHYLLLKAQASSILNRFDEARVLILKARAAADEANSAALMAEVDLREGSLMAMSGNFTGARQACDNAIRTARTLHDRNLEARAAGNYGLSLMNESRYDEAIPWFESAEKTAKEIGADDTAARHRGNIGACYARLGDYATAHVCYEAARSHFEKAGNLYELQAWTGNEATLFLNDGDTNEAAVRYQRALKLARQIENPAWTSRWLLNLATTSIKLEDWEAADGYNREGLALNRATKDTMYEPLSLTKAADIARGRGRFDEAATLYREALNGQSEDPTVALDAHTGLAGLYVRSGEPKKADEEFRIAIAAIDSRQEHLLKDEYRLSWLASVISFYREYADFLVAQGKPEEALGVAESSRSKVLASSAGAPSALRPRSMAEYRQLAQAAHATLLEYFFGVSASYLWVIMPAAVRFHSLPAGSAIRPLVERYRAVIAAGRNPLEVANEAGVKLYDILVAPAQDGGQQSGRFVVVADDGLNGLNFESLPDGDHPDRFWIERATIRIAPSLSYLATEGPRGGSGILLIGDPTQSPTFPRLEFAGQEIDAIAEAMPGQRATRRTGAAATPASYKEAQPGEFGYIHFAAHALMNSTSPLDSAVILSGPPDKSRLLAREVVSAPLKAELVTVSACRSAGGKSYAGEGLVGFAWAFLKAGAANVIAGLWDVNDKSTTQMMTDLYRRIGAGEAVPDALRAAKLGLIRQGGAYAKPFYWAPFQLYTGRV